MNRVVRALILIATAVGIVALVSLLWGGLSGCSPREAPAEVAQETVAPAVVSAVVAVREVVEPALPPPPPPAIDPFECPAAIDLIVDFEVVSLAYYERKLQGVICPPAASGPTWGIGYDGGHQTRARILGDWPAHPSRDLLAETSGVTGQAACRPLVRDRLVAVRTPLAMARPVFAGSTLPRYDAMAERAFSDGWSSLFPCTRGSLRSLAYNRGTGMAGDRRREIRTIKNECVPMARDDPLAAAHCVARELRAMVRLWANTDIEAGMRRRRYAEADLALRSDG
jgi:hypothetical protein